MKRNRFLLLIVMVAVFLASTVLPAAAQDDALLIWADETRAAVMQELAEEFTEEFGIAVRITELGFGDIRDQLLVAGPVGEGPDIVVLPHDMVGQLVQNGAILPIDLTGLESEFAESALSLFTYQNELWAVPYAMEAVVMVRNADMVPEAPTTWEEVREISEQIMESGEAQYGFLIQSGNAYHNYGVISAFGGYIFGRNEDGTFNVSDIGYGSEGGLAAAEWLEGMYTDGIMVPEVGDDIVLELYNQGELAMWITGPWDTPDLIASQESGINVALNTVPGGMPFSGGQGFMISAFSDNQLLAETFLLDFMATQEAMQRLYDADPRIPVFAGIDAATNPFIDDFIVGAANAVPMPAIPEMNAVWGAAGDALTIIANGGDGTEAFTNAAEQIAANIEIAASGAMNSVTLVGSLQDEAGCDADWNPGCEVTFMENMDGIWTIVVTLPAGDYEYKIAINADWAENYGADGELNGGNIALSLSDETEVTFTWDQETKVVTDSVNGM